MAAPEAETLAPMADVRDLSSTLEKSLNFSRGLNISSLASTLIKPAVPTQPHYILLSNLDLLVLPVYSTLILLYRGSGVDAEQRDRLAGLKSSLSTALVDFYPMAGRLVSAEPSDAPRIHCNDAGAVWQEASTDTELADLEDYYPVEQLLGIPAKEAGPGPFYPARNAEGVPILAIQATLFKCGGVSLSVAWHHSVADGKSGWNFLRSWAEVSRGERISTLPSFDRSLIQPSRSVGLSAPPAGYVLQLNSGGPPTPGRGSDPMIDLSSTSGMLLKKILVSKQRVEELKKAAAEVDRNAAAGVQEAALPAARSFSSAVSVAAYLWTILTRSRELPAEGLTHFSLTVDGRSSMNLPDNYFGNALSWACAECKAGQLLSGPLSTAARTIHESIRTTRTPESYQWLIDAVEIHGAQSVKFRHQSCFGQDVGATFWTQMHLYELDFGLGSPIFGGRNVMPRKALDGFFAVQPCSPHVAEPGSLLVLAYLNDEVADRLFRLHPDLTVL